MPRLPSGDGARFSAPAPSPRADAPASRSAPTSSAPRSPRPGSGGGTAREYSLLECLAQRRRVVRGQVAHRQRHRDLVPLPDIAHVGEPPLARPARRARPARPARAHPSPSRRAARRRRRNRNRRAACGGSSPARRKSAPPEIRPPSRRRHWAAPARARARASRRRAPHAAAPRRRTRSACDRSPPRRARPHARARRSPCSRTPSRAPRRPRSPARQPERIADRRRERGARQIRIERDRAARERRRIDHAERNVRIGHGRPHPAAPVAGRPRLGAGAFRPDGDALERIDLRDRAAAGADLDHLDHRNAHRQPGAFEETRRAIDLDRRAPNSARNSRSGRSSPWCRPCRTTAPSSRPPRAATCAAKIAPPAGPDSTSRTGKRRAVSIDGSPPPEVTR